MQSVRKVLKDRKFRIFKGFLQLHLIDKNKVIIVLMRQFDKLTDSDANLYLFKNDGSPLISFIKFKDKVYYHLFSVDRNIKSFVRNTKKDKYWYYNDNFKGYIKYTPDYAGVKIYKYSDEYDNGYKNGMKAGIEDREAGNEHAKFTAEYSQYNEGYKKGYDAGYYNKDSYDLGFEDGSNNLPMNYEKSDDEYVKGYMDGEDSIFNGNKGGDDKIWSKAYDCGHKDGSEELQKRNNSDKPHEYQNGYNIGYEHGKQKSKIINDDYEDISEYLCKPYYGN